MISNSDEWNACMFIVSKYFVSSPLYPKPLLISKLHPLRSLNYNYIFTYSNCIGLYMLSNFRNDPNSGYCLR